MEHSRDKVTASVLTVRLLSHSHRIGGRSCPGRVTVLLLVHEQPYRAGVRRFHPSGKLDSAWYVACVFWISVLVYVLSH